MASDGGLYRKRRKQLAGDIDGGLLVLTAYDLMQQSNDMPHPFRQEANFWYLTGIDVPGWQMIYDGTRDKCWLVRPKTTEVEKLFGGEISDEEVLKLSGADGILLEADFDATLRQHRRQHAAAYTCKPSLETFNFVINPAQRRLTLRLERVFASVNDVRRELADRRAIKQPEEIALMKKAIAITASAFATVQKKVLDYKYEYEVEAEFWAQFRSRNAAHAYSPIIASGGNATVLHHENNSDRVEKRRLLLMDCGACFKGYNADITRTIAVGRPTNEQQQMYHALLDAQQQILRLIRPGVSFREYQQEVDVIMKRMLQALGLIDSTSDEKAYRNYFPHAVSHGLGIDVHESLGSSSYFKPGMVLTVEPGVYVAHKNIGIRIEDDILVTENGSRNLTKGVSTALL